MNHERLEIKKSILRKVESEINTDSNGRRFPHPCIEIQLFAPNEADENIFKNTFENNILHNEVNSLLSPPRCTVPAKPSIIFSYIQNTEDIELVKNGFVLKFLSKRAEENSDTEMFLEVLEGVANRKRMRIIYDETFIGRCENVEKKGGGIYRKNDLYFPDAREIKGEITDELKAAEKINGSVSRLHARLRKQNNKYILYDDGSTFGTTLLRGNRGTSYEISGKVGKEIEEGDVISFGKAKVKVVVQKKQNQGGETSKTEPK
jgi:hypothetical protein